MWSNIKCLYGDSNDCGVCLDVKRCKETNVARLLSESKSLKEIAEHFGVSIRTVERYYPFGFDKRHASVGRVVSQYLLEGV